MANTRLSYVIQCIQPSAKWLAALRIFIKLKVPLNDLRHLEDNCIL